MHAADTPMFSIDLVINITNDEVTVFSPQRMQQILLSQTGKCFLPCQVAQLLGDHVNGVLISPLYTERKQYVIGIKYGYRIARDKHSFLAEALGERTHRPRFSSKFRIDKSHKGLTTWKG